MKVYLDIHTHRKGNRFSIYNSSLEDTETDQPFSLGLHPWGLDLGWEHSIENLLKYLSQPKLFAIGECGFDLVKGPTESIQIQVFSEQARLAKDYGLPVILHCVRGFHLLQQYLKKTPFPPFIIWHGFNQKMHICQRLLPYPIYFSFGEAIFKENSNAQIWLKECPLDRIFFETDSSEKNISSIYEQASLILRLPVDVIAEQVKANWNHISNKTFNE